MNQEQTLQKHIKEASASSHQQLEKIIVGLLKNINSNEDYAKLLGYFFNYFSLVEEKITACQTTALLADYDTRRKSHLLKNDIQELGYEVELYQDIALPQIEDAIDGMGALYVMEGSTLGGGTIVKILGSKGISKGISFFSGYGDQTFPKWNIFLQALNNLAINEEEKVRLTNTVTNTFQCFNDFIKKQEVNNNLVAAD